MHGAGNERVPSGHNGKAVSDLKAGSETRLWHGSAKDDD